MAILTVKPAYGRDYKSLEAAEEDWLTDRDFIIADISNRWSGKPVNKRDLVGTGTQIRIRYDKLTKVGFITGDSGCL